MKNVQSCGQQQMQICTYHVDKIRLISFVSLCFYGVGLCVIQYKMGSISFQFSRLLLGILIFALLGSICRYTYTHVALFFLNKERKVHCMHINSLTRFCPWLSFPSGLRTPLLFLLHYLYCQRFPYVFHSYGSFEKYNSANKRVKLSDISKSQTTNKCIKLF